jgi:hypothetical protein
MFRKGINLAGFSQVQPLKFVPLFPGIVLAFKLYHSQDHCSAQGVNFKCSAV